jgi:putative endonuclease
MSIFEGRVPTERAAIVSAMTDVRQAVGAYGERVAVQHLLNAGLAVLDRNWRSATGEIDIVARDGDVLVLCEVKTRRGLGFGTPAEAVDRRKVARLRRLAAEWLAESGLHPREVRFDVVEVYFRPGRPPRVARIEGAF